MTRGIVKTQTFWGVLFNQQIATVFFDDGGNGDTGIPTSAHLKNVSLDCKEVD
jgi:hypothetical protein